MGSACNTSETVLDVFHGSVCCQSLSYGWSEVRKAGSGGPADCRQIFSPDYLRQMMWSGGALQSMTKGQEGKEVPRGCAVPESIAERDLERMHGA